MGTYKIIARSHERTIALGLLLLIIYLFIAGYGFPHMISSERFFVTIVIALIAHFSIRKLTTAKTEWTLSEEGILIKWVTNYFGTKDKNFEIKWSDIRKYKDVSGRGYDLFKIYLLSGETVKLGHSGIFIFDDFTKFYEEFQQMYLKKKHPVEWTKYYYKKSQQ